MKFRIIVLASLLIILFSLSCKKKKVEPVPEVPIVGTPGNPRFNLQFNNHENVDLDLYVETPNGSIIYFARPYGQNGELDVDCLCGACPNGPSENIFWVPGSAPSGTYKFWVEYYGDCNGKGEASEFTLRVLNNSKILETYKGTLSKSNRKSVVYTKTY